MDYKIPTCISLPISLRRKLEELRQRRERRDKRRATISSLVEEAILKHFNIKGGKKNES